MQQIELYCKKCHKSLKMAYMKTGNANAPVLPGMLIRCNTNKCTRVMVLKKFTEGMIISQMDKNGKVFI